MSHLMENLFSDPDDTFLLYGDTGSGKTAQLGEVAEHIHAATGKPSLLNTADRGGWKAVLKPLLNLGIIEAESLLVGDPFVALNAATQGKRLVNKAWVLDDMKKYGAIFFESLSGFAEGGMLNM